MGWDNQTFLSLGQSRTANGLAFDFTGLGLGLGLGLEDDVFPPPGVSRGGEHSSLAFGWFRMAHQKLRANSWHLDSNACAPWRGHTMHGDRLRP